MSNFLRRYPRLAAINIVSNLTVPLAGLIDTAMLGHLDEIRFLAGVALAAILFEYIYWTFGFLRMGTTGTAAQALGRGDDRELSLVLYRSIALALCIAGGILLLQWPLRELGLALLQGEPGVEAAARDYFDALVWGAPAALCNFALVGWYLGRAESRAALVMTAVANLGNVAFNYLFIVELGWAARGAGLGTMLSQYLSLGAGLFLLSRRSLAAWVWNEVLDRARLVAVMKLNVDILIRTLCLVSSFAVFTNFGAMLGVQLLAANTILLRVLTLAAHLIDGAAFATESLAGILHGRGDRAGLRRLLRLSLAVGEAFAVAVLAAVLLAPRTLLGLLTSHADVIERAVGLSPWLVPVLVFGAPAYMLDGFFLGLTAGTTLRRAMLISTLAVFLPAAVLALSVESAAGLWAALALFMLARTVTLGWATRPALD